MTDFLEAVIHWKSFYEHGHTAGFNMENQQAPAGQHRELCSILCNNLNWAGGEGGKEDEMVGWNHQISGHEFEQTLGDSERQGTLEGSSPPGPKSQT